MRQQIYFVTTSANKFQELNSWLAQLNPTIELEQYVMDLPEIQSLDLKEVAIAKAHDAWQKLRQPLLVDDAGLFLHKYPLFPGPLTKFVHQAIGMEGILYLAGNDRKAEFRNCLVYMKSPDEYYVFEGITRGTLIDFVQRSDQQKQLHCIDVLIPEGYDRSFAELMASNQVPYFHYRYLALKSFCDFLG